LSPFATITSRAEICSPVANVTVCRSGPFAIPVTLPQMNEALAGIAARRVFTSES
jgi:hypothetical protein